MKVRSRASRPQAQRAHQLGLRSYKGGPWRGVHCKLVLSALLDDDDLKDLLIERRRRCDVRSVNMGQM